MKGLLLKQISFMCLFFSLFISDHVFQCDTTVVKNMWLYEPDNVSVDDRGSRNTQTDRQTDRQAGNKQSARISHGVNSSLWSVCYRNPSTIFLMIKNEHWMLEEREIFLQLDKLLMDTEYLPAPVCSSDLCTGACRCEKESYLFAKHETLELLSFKHLKIERRKNSQSKEKPLESKCCDFILNVLFSFWNNIV